MQSRNAILKAGAIAGFICAAAFVLHAIFTSTRGTAIIGVIFIPVYGIPAAAAGWALAYIVLTLSDLGAGRVPWKSKNALIAATFLGGFIFAGQSVLVRQQALSVAENPASAPQALEAISQHWIPWGRDKVYVALAQNPSTPPAVLSTLVDTDDGEVIDWVGANPNTDFATLEKIVAVSPNPEQISDRMRGLAGNPRISRAMMERILAISAKDFHNDAGAGWKVFQSVLTKLAKNPALPQDLFNRLAATSNAERFLIEAIVDTPYVTCTQISHFLASPDPWGQFAARSKLQERGCPAASTEKNG